MSKYRQKGARLCSPQHHVVVLGTEGGCGGFRLEARGAVSQLWKALPVHVCTAGVLSPHWTQRSPMMGWENCFLAFMATSSSSYYKLLRFCFQTAAYSELGFEARVLSMITKPTWFS